MPVLTENPSVALPPLSTMLYSFWAQNPHLIIPYLLVTHSKCPGKNHFLFPLKISNLTSTNRYLWHFVICSVHISSDYIVAGADVNSADDEKYVLQYDTNHSSCVVEKGLNHQMCLLVLTVVVFIIRFIIRFNHR